MQRAVSGQVGGDHDVTDHDGELIRTAPRTVLRRAIEHLSELGYRAQVGVETEFFLLDAQGQPLTETVHCYSLEKPNELGPALAQIADGLDGYVPVEAVTSEYGPGQLEINMHHADPLTAADDAFRLKYAVRALARAAGARATFMAKPFQGLSGSSMHLHLSLWQADTPAFAPEAGAENSLMRAAIAGIARHLPAITVFGAPNINSYKRFEARSYAPATATWGGDNRTASVRTLLEADRATFGRGGPHRCLGEHLARLELRAVLRELLPVLPRLRPDGPPARIRSNFTNGLKRLPVRLT